MSKEFNINLEGNSLVIEERTGKLPDLPPIPKTQGVVVNGVLGSVFEFLSYRLPLIDKQVSIVTVDRKELTITAETNPTVPELSDTVTGSIDINPDLKSFKINAVGNQFSRETLLGFLRTNRQYFPNKEAHMQLLSAVKNLNLRVSIQNDRNEDNRGNRSSDFNKTVAAENIPLSTIIEIPVFVGERPVSIQLDICYDTSENNIYFWFESAELNEIIYNASEWRLQEEIDKIKALGFLVLE